MSDRNPLLDDRRCPQARFDASDTATWAPRKAPDLITA